MRKTGKIDELGLNLVFDADIKRLERVKSLLTEIHELKNKVFGKQAEKGLAVMELGKATDAVSVKSNALTSDFH